MPATKTYARPLTRPRTAHLYERDFYAWTQEQAELLRSQTVAGLDWLNIAEEIDGLGRSEKREIESRLQLVIAHLLKWRIQSGGRSGSWEATISEQRRQLHRRLAENPSLRDYPGAVLADLYPLSRLRAVAETAMNEADFPEVCPFSIDEVLNDDFWPDAD